MSARNVQATLCRVLSISFVEAQNSRTALRGFVQILLGRSGLVWLCSGSSWAAGCGRFLARAALRLPALRGSVPALAAEGACALRVFQSVVVSSKYVVCLWFELI